MEKHKQVVCIDNYGREIFLTKGRVYNVIEETEDRYLLVNGYGFEKYYYKDRFKELKEEQFLTEDEIISAKSSLFIAIENYSNLAKQAITNRDYDNAVDYIQQMKKLESIVSKFK